MASFRRAAATRALSGFLPFMALVLTIGGCAASRAAVHPSPLNVPDYTSGAGGSPDPVTDLSLEQMVPSGGVAVTATPVHGSSPSSPPDLALGRFTHLGGTLSVVFLCISPSGAQVGSTWYNSSGPLPCDPGPDTRSESVATCQGPCSGRDWFTFTVPNTAMAVMPQFQVPATGVSWTLFAWIAPEST